MKSLLKYCYVIKIGLQSIGVYKFQFWMRQIRAITMLVTYYLFWWVVFKDNSQVLGYQRDSLIVYLLIAVVLKPLVFSSVSLEIASDISTGNLSNYLVRPVNYFGYWFARDVADKIGNFCVTLFILGFLVIILPSFFLPYTTWFSLLKILLIIALAMLLYFLLSVSVLLSTFWQKEHQGWPQVFVFLVIIELASGLFFPLNMLPKELFFWVQWLPTSYLIFFPSQLILGNVTLSFGQMVITMLGWCCLFGLLIQRLWSEGLKINEATGR